MLHKRKSTGFTHSEHCKFAHIVRQSEAWEAPGGMTDSFRVLCELEKFALRDCPDIVATRPRDFPPEVGRFDPYAGATEGRKLSPDDCREGLKSIIHALLDSDAPECTARARECAQKAIDRIELRKGEKWFLARLEKLGMRL